eukprot:m.518223 g.518223  ORF g.518223 m.518223 type:complete len:222 (+) comp57483_c0_seq39:102-767(+)
MCSRCSISFVSMCARGLWHRCSRPSRTACTQRTSLPPSPSAHSQVPHAAHLPHSASYICLLSLALCLLCVRRASTYGILRSAPVQRAPVPASTGLWPIPGTTVVITFLLCYLARAVTSDWSVSIVLAQVCNLVLTPVELALIPFFLRAGEFALQSNDPIDASVLLSSGIVDIIKSSSTAFVRAVIGWVLVSPFLGMVLYFAMVPIITRLLVIRRQYGVIKQ